MAEPVITRKVIQDAGEVPLVLYSDVRAPLQTLSFLRRALAMAELAMIAYNDDAEARRAAQAIGFPEAEFLDHDGAQVYRFSNQHDIVWACRGTEISEWNDVQADANATFTVISTMGKVHSGFNQEVNDLWPLMENLLRDTSRPIWFCGHSLGGAMATICAYRCTTSPQTNNPEELHTFGSPRVGCKRYVRHADVCHYRWVHNNDVVTRVPPTWLGYRHSGHQVYLDRHGRIRKLRGVWRTRDRWHGFVKGLLKWKFDPVADHSIHLYTKHIATAVNKENQAIAKGGAATDENDLVIGKKTK